MLQDIRTLLAATDYRKLFIGQLVSGLGDWLATFAFMALIFALTGKATAVAFILVLRLIPPIFTAPIGGVFADRLPRRTIMMTADITRTVLIAFVPFSGLGLLYVLAFLHECASLFFIPARDALIPQLVPEDSLELGNGLIIASTTGVLPLAGIVFSVLEGVGGHYPAALPFAFQVNTHPEVLAFFVDSLTFIFSAYMIVRMRVKTERRRIAAHRQARFWADFRLGFGTVWHNPGLRRLAYGVIVAMFGGGVLFAVGVGYVRQTLHESAAAFGWLIALWGVGMTIGLLGVRGVARQRGRMYVFTAAILAIGGTLISMSVVPLALLAFALAVPFGAAFAAALILAMTLAQELADEQTRGTTMGGFQALFNLGLGIGAICFGWLASTLNQTVFLGLTLDGNRLAMLIGGIIICCGAVIVAIQR